MDKKKSAHNCREFSVVITDLILTSSSSCALEVGFRDTWI